MQSLREEMRAMLFERRGKTLSGQEAAKRLGVSRAAVWKAVEGLRAEGLAIESVKGRGYRLPEDNDELCEAALRVHLPGAPLRVLGQVDSTNTEARRWALEGAPHGALVVAQRQTAGRGRMGRLFESPPGGLYMSVILRPQPGQEGLPLLTAATAVATCDAVSELCGRELSIKWVNDLFYEGKKCCGILSEGVAGLESGGFDHLVTGIGINYTTPEEAFPKELRETVTSLFPDGCPPVPRAQLAAAIYGRLMALFPKLPQREFLPEYRRRNLVPGRHVRVLASPPYEGRAVSIDEDARLVVRTADGREHRLSSGEVSVLLEDS